MNPVRLSFLKPLPDLNPSSRWITSRQCIDGSNNSSGCIINDLELKSFSIDRNQFFTKMIFLSELHFDRRINHNQFIY